VSACHSDYRKGVRASPLLAFAERQLLAKSRRQRQSSITSGSHQKADILVSDVRYVPQADIAYDE
jgi:hypothetical protein